MDIDVLWWMAWRISCFVSGKMCHCEQLERRQRPVWKGSWNRQSSVAFIPSKCFVWFLGLKKRNFLAQNIKKHSIRIQGQYTRAKVHYIAVAVFFVDGFTSFVCEKQHSLELNFAFLQKIQRIPFRQSRVARQSRGSEWDIWPPRFTRIGTEFCLFRFNRCVRVPHTVQFHRCCRLVQYTHKRTLQFAE